MASISERNQNESPKVFLISFIRWHFQVSLPLWYAYKSRIESRCLLYLLGFHGFSLNSFTYSMRYFFSINKRIVARYLSLDIFVWVQLKAPLGKKVEKNRTIKLKQLFVGTFVGRHRSVPKVWGGVGDGFCQALGPYFLFLECYNYQMSPPALWEARG